MKPKKAQISLTILLIIGLGILLVWGGNKGWFKSSLNIYNQNPPASKEKVILLEQPPTTTETCSISLNPLVIFAGDTVTGIIQDGINRYCEVYATDGSEWVLVYDGTTDATGRLSSTQVIGLIGTFTFRALCGSCITNEITLQVNPLPDDETPTIDCDEYCTLSWDYDYGHESSTCEPWERNIWYYDTSCCCGPVGGCVDSDGGDYPYTKGYVGGVDGTVYNYDYCHDGDTVYEYYCVSDGWRGHKRNCNSDDVCVSSSNGAECQTETAPPLDSDGDGYSDAEEQQAGTNPNDPNSYPGGLAEQCADECNANGYAWSNYMPGSSPSACLGEAYNVCFPLFGLQYEDSSYSDSCCCFECQ